MSFVVGYAAVAWLLRFVAGHTYSVFIAYRLVVGSAILAVLGLGAVASH